MPLAPSSQPERSPLALVRFLRGLSQRQLAERAGIAKRTITYLESGEHAPRPTTAQALAAALGTDVDFDAGVIRVRRGWDDKEGEIEVKSDAGRRNVPLAGLLRRELAAHKLRTGRQGGDLVFGRTAGLPFTASTVRARAHKAWNAAGLEPLTPHEARHCAVSYFTAAGCNAKQISVYIGHGDVRQTWNRYGHLMPGDEATAAAQLDAFLTPSRAAG